MRDLLVVRFQPALPFTIADVCILQRQQLTQLAQRHVMIQHNSRARGEAGTVGCSDIV